MINLIFVPRYDLVRGTLYACLLMLGLPWAAGAAQTTPPVTEQDIYQDMPVVLSLTRLAQPASKVPGTVTVIDREMIDATGARNIPDLLRLVPGFMVGYKSGNKPVVTYHGLSDTFSRRLQVLVDGRSVYIASFGGVPWNDLPLAMEDIDHIEVIRGPDTAAYGANSFLAVISIHTRSAASAAGNYAKVLWGVRHEKETLVRHGGHLGDTDYRVTVSSKRDDLFDSKNDFNQSVYLTARSDTRLSANDSLLAEMGLLNGPRGEGADNNIHVKKIDSNFQQLKWTRKLGYQNDVSIQFFHNFHNWHEHYTDQGSGLPVPLNVRTDRYDLELQHRLKPSNSTRLVWGLNSRVDRVDSGLIFYHARSVTYRLNRAFANLEWQLMPTLTTNLSVMGEDNSFTGTEFSPRLAVNYSISPKHSLRAVISKATRVPSAIEDRADWYACTPPLCPGPMYPVFMGNTSLKAERIISRELGYYGTPRRNLSVDVRLYHDRISNLISIPHASPVFTNTDYATLHGIELQANYRPTPKDRLFIGYAYTHVKSADIGDNYASSAPRHMASLLALHHFAHAVDGSLAYYYMGNFHPLDGDLIRRMDRLDVRLSKRFKTERLRGRVSLVGENVLGAYEEYQTDTLYKPSMYLSVELEL
jgi:iron complex outermembrane receptor protein